MLALRIKNTLSLALVSIAALFLSACGSDDNENVMTPEPPALPTPVNVSYEITLTNLTHLQPLSPVAVILHQEGSLWGIGESASVELEQMAEGGDNSGLLGLSMVLASESGVAPIPPGGSETISITVQDITDAKLSIASMLVNTNDAFTGLNAWNLDQLEVGQSYRVNAKVYDAGTEANSEALGTIPGPADGSEGAGYLEQRNDVDFVAGHPGVVTADDGLTSSVLNSMHKFDNPALRIVITRSE